VKAALAPDHEWQNWLTNVPLICAQQHAESKTKLLQSDESKHIPVDTNVPGVCILHRSSNVTIFTSLAPEITSGEASDLLNKAFDGQRRQNIEKKLAKLQKSEIPIKRGQRRASS
jgi:hypothetical protein